MRSIAIAVTITGDRGTNIRTSRAPESPENLRFTAPVDPNYHRNEVSTKEERSE
jgi:hypothetical protein